MGLPSRTARLALADPYSAQASITGLRFQDVLPLNIKDFGAVGDGVADDTLAINNALQAAADLGGAVVFGPTGTYLNSGIIINGSHISLVGAGRGLTIFKLKAASNVAPIRTIAATQAYPALTRLTDLYFADFSIDGNFYNQTTSPAPYFEADGLWVKYAERVVVDNVEAYDTWTDGVLFQAVQRGVIRNCLFRRNGQATVTIDNQPTTASANGASTGTLTNGAAGYGVNAYQNKLVYVFSGTGAGQVRGIQSNTATVLTVSDPWDVLPDATSKWRVLTANTNASGIGVRGLIAVAELAASIDIVIANNIVEANTGTGNGIFVSGDIQNGTVLFNGKHINIVGNVVINPYDEGIEVKNTNDTTITGNTVCGSVGGSDGRNISDAILVREAQNAVVTGNYVRDYYNGITAATFTVSLASDISITGNTVINCNKDLVNGRGIKLLAQGGFNIFSIAVGSNRVYNSGKAAIGASVSGGSIIHQVSVVGNTLAGGSFVGIWFDNATVRDALIVGNTCANNGAGGGGFGSGIYIDACSNILVASNRCYDDAVAPQNYGITLANACNQLECVDNNVYGNVTSGLRLSAFSGNNPRVENNNGWNIAGVSGDRGDTSPTFTVGTDQEVQRFATALTANRTITLASANTAVNGNRFRVVRTGLGAFTLDVGGVKTIPAGTAAFVDVAYDGTAWRLVAYGTL